MSFKTYTKSSLWTQRRRGMRDGGPQYRPFSCAVFPSLTLPLVQTLGVLASLPLCLRAVQLVTWWLQFITNFILLPPPFWITLCFMIYFSEEIRPVIEKLAQFSHSRRLSWLSSVPASEHQDVTWSGPLWFPHTHRVSYCFGFLPFRNLTTWPSFIVFVALPRRISGW